MNIGLFTSYRDRIIENCRKVICGKDREIEMVLIAFLCSGHILLEDVPGTGKTMLLRSFAASVGGSFKRIQCTPDLLPGDLTGINFYNRKTDEFEFRPGPIFSQIILADEINRATPRTQSGLLEAMEERQVTVDGTTYPMEENFLVMATQNPLENYGTFPLPEAQIDRFFMRIGLGFMSREDELSVLFRRPGSELVKELTAVVSAEETAELKRLLPEVQMSGDTAGYLMDIIEATRTNKSFVTGVSTRGAIALFSAARAKAALSGRDYVIPEDIRDMAPAVLAHRIGGANASKQDSETYIAHLLDTISVPVEKL